MRHSLRKHQHSSLKLDKNPHSYFEKMDKLRSKETFYYCHTSINLITVILFQILLGCCCIIKLSHQQSSISLNTAQWFVSNSNGSIYVPAQVPGGIYSDLRRNQILRQDILYGKNDIVYRWVGNENWTYTTSFAIDQQIAMSQSVRLVLHGIDTIASIILNGEEIGQTDNMFVRYKFDVKPQLKLAGLKNVLIIKFESPVKYAARQSHQSVRQNRGKIVPPYCPSPAQRGECHVNFIRKMQASFSWDWGPAFPSMGIYKNIELEYGSFGLIRDILVETRREPSLTQSPRAPPQAPPQIIISSTIKHNVRIPTIDRSVPYIRAPPYYVGMSNESNHNPLIDLPRRIDLKRSNQQIEDNWLLKITLVAEMVQPSFGYNVRVEFNLNGILHYESEHINVVANSEGFIRLGFNLRIDSSRMQVKPWWPNNAGSQTLYQLTARMMPIPSAPDRIHIHGSPEPLSMVASEHNQQLSLQARSKPLQTPAVPVMVFLATTSETGPDISKQLSEKEIWFGFRTVELIQEPIVLGDPEAGLTFNFRINGVDLFAMGSNWIPASVLPENSNDFEHIRYLLQSAKDANMNMLRVWGGGIYESDEFYRLADELGIMIWHDFMFACALYPVDDAFIASVRLEIEQQVQRLQYHPSIVLWAGNNENEMAIASPWWPEVLVWNKKLRENYAKLFSETIRPIVRILDPTRPYVESSPSNGFMSESQVNTISRYPNDNKYGDVHHYEYFTDSFDWTVYPSTRFASEYGFQSYPSFNALTSVSPATDWKYPLTPNILHRQHRLTGETEIKLQMKVHFNDIKAGGIDKFKGFIYISQLTQAIAIKTETEFYRRNRFIDPETKLGKTMGALYWQLNDVWPAPTWSSIEYGGKWKILHYFARRFFFPIQVIPYLIQPSAISSISNSIQQTITTGSSIQSNLRPSNLMFNQQQQQGFFIDPLAQQSQNQQQASNGPLFVVDLIRDDLFDLLDSFNVTIRFYRWTSFVPVWQDTVYVRNTRPQNVTRIYEQDANRILRQPGVVSFSSGVFQVLIEQQPRLGLSQIENYLMPVAPNKVTAMRVAKINVELVQGPFELTDANTFDQNQSRARSTNQQESLSSHSQWECAYRLTLVTDSIAMFVWLDLNLMNAGGNGNGSEAQQTAPQTNAPNEPLEGQQTTFDRQRTPTATQGPQNIHLNALPLPLTQPPFQIFTETNNHGPRPQLMPPEHIRLHLDRPSRRPIDDMDRARYGPNVSEEAFGTVVSERTARVRERRNWPVPVVTERTNSANHALPKQRINRQIESEKLQQPPERIVINIDNDMASQMNNRDQMVNNQYVDRQQEFKQRRHTHRAPSPTFKPIDASGGNMLRYQFSDNAFNMFEPSKVIDLYLGRCLSKLQVEVALEVQSLADSL